MPSLRPRTSWLPTADLSQTPACMALFFSVSWRPIAMISAMASSTTERVLEKGALKTAMPWAAAAARSIWLVPMQKAPIAVRCGLASMTRWVTTVFERMPSRSTSARAARSSSSSIAPERVSTS